MKDMLITLLKNGNIGKGDVIDALYFYKERESMLFKMPDITMRTDRNDYVANIPAKLSPTGKRKQISGKTEKEVKEKYRELIILNDDVPKLGTYMLSILYDVYFQNRAKSTFDRYECICRTIVIENDIGQKPINQIDGNMITIFFKTITNGKYNKYTPSVLKGLLKKVFDNAIRDKWITENPMDYADISFKRCKKTVQELETFDLEELNVLGKTIINSYDKDFQKKHKGVEREFYFYSPMFMVMAYTGMRIGEMRGLRKNDVYRDECIIHIENQIVDVYLRDESGKKVKKIQECSIPKTEGSTRDTILTNDALFWLDELERRQLERGINSEFYVTNSKGRYPKEGNIWDTWVRVLRDANLEYRTLHKLRKTFVSYCLTYGGDMLTLVDVSKMVGHNKTTTTLNDYLKTISRSKMKEKSKIIQGIFNGDHNNKLSTTLSTDVNSFGQGTNVIKMREAL